MNKQSHVKKKDIIKLLLVVGYCVYILLMSIILLCRAIKILNSSTNNIQK